MNSIESALLIVMLSGVALHAQTLEVVPSRVLMDEPAVLRVSGLMAGERVRIRAELTNAAGHRWASWAEFVADDHGVVDASRQAPVAGSYRQVSVR